MKPTTMQRLDQFGRCSTPALLTLFLIMLTVVPITLPPFDTVEPGLVLISVYFWAIHRPDLMPLAAVFGLGAAQDLITGTPPGINAFSLLLVYYAVSSQRVFFLGRPFLATWFGFTIVAAIFALVIWLLACLLRSAVIDPGPVLLQSVVTILLYPPMAWLLAMVQRLVVPSED